MNELCHHCEKAPRGKHSRLCENCAAVRGIRRLYRKTIHWTPERDAHIQSLVEKAKRGEPLFSAAAPPADVPAALKEVNCTP